MVNEKSNGLKKQIRLFGGKIRRIIYVSFRKKYVEKQLKHRVGDCARCGACCELVFKCPALRYENGLAKCTAYKFRSQVCRKFPIDEKDMAERDIVANGRKCGYRFLSSDGSN